MVKLVALNIAWLLVKYRAATDVKNVKILSKPKKVLKRWKNEKSVKKCKIFDFEMCDVKLYEKLANLDGSPVSRKNIDKVHARTRMENKEYQQGHMVNDPL